MKKVSLVTDGGIYKKIISGALIIIASFNLISGIFRGVDPVKILTFVIPVYTVSLLFFFVESKLLLSIALLLIGVISTVFSIEVGNYSGSIFFAFSFFMFTNYYYASLLLIATIISISINSNINNINFNNTFNLIIAYFIVYAIFYLIIYRKIKNLEKKIKELERQLKEKQKPKPMTRNIDVIDISEEEKAIIKLYCKGMSYENISRFLGLNVVPKTIRRKITAIMNDNDLKNDAHFGHWLFQKAEIDNNVI